MLTSTDPLIRPKRPGWQRLREATIAWFGGIAVTAATFQAIYSMIFAWE